MGEIIQPPLFETPQSVSDSRIIELIKIGLDRIAFGITKTELKKGDFDVLKYIFYGMNNLDFESFLEIPTIENPDEILSSCFAAGGLKKGNRHLKNSRIPHEFLKLKNYLNNCSYSDEKFASLANRFKKYFDNRPGRQRTRFEILLKQMRSIRNRNAGDEFVNSLLSPYIPSDKENSFAYGFHDLGYKKFYVDGIYEKFEFLNEKAKNSLSSLSSGNSEQLFSII